MTCNDRRAESTAQASYNSVTPTGGGRGILIPMKRSTTLFFLLVNAALAGWLLVLVLPGAPAETSPRWAPAKPKAKAETKKEAGITDAEYKKEVARVEGLVAGMPFTVLLQRPFVVVGDEKPAAVRQRARRTVKWAVDHLKELYFEKDPDDIITIWLLKDDESYYNRPDQG